MEHVEEKKVNKTSSFKPLFQIITKRLNQINNDITTISSKYKSCNLTDALQLKIFSDLYRILDKIKAVYRTYQELGFLMQIIITLESDIALIKSEINVYFRQNQKLKERLNQFNNSYHYKQLKLIVIQENIRFHSNMLDYYKMENDKEVMDIEHRIWHQCLYERIWLRPTSVTNQIQTITRLIKNNFHNELNYLANDILIKDHSYFDKEILYQKALCFLLLARYFYNNCLIEKAIIFSFEALHLVEKLDLKRPLFLANILSCIGILLLKNVDESKALPYFYESVKIIDSYCQNDSEWIGLLANKYVELGTLMSQEKFYKDGIKFLELGVVTYSILLPEEEDNWSLALVKLTKVCNEGKYFEDSTVICERLLSYYHKKFLFQHLNELKPKNIFELALELEEKYKQSTIFSIEAPFYGKLPSWLESVVCELVVAFTENFSYSAAKFLIDWFNRCREITENNESIPLNIIQIKINCDIFNSIDNLEAINQPDCVNLCQGEHLSTQLTKKCSLKLNQISTKFTSLFHTKHNDRSSSLESTSSNNECSQQKNSSSENPVKIKRIFKMLKNKF